MIHSNGTKHNFYPYGSNPNLEVYTHILYIDGKEVEYKCRIIFKEKENDDAVASLVTASAQLEKKDIDFVAINGLILTYDDFKFKSSDKINKTKVLEVFTNQYEIKVINDFLSFCKKLEL